MDELAEIIVTPSSSSDYPLTNPDNMKGIAAKSVKNVTAYDRAYNVTDDFKTINGTTYSNHCGPTTGTNVLKYWFGRDTTKYSKLYDNNLWKSAFVELYGSMKTGTNGTTYLSDYTSAIKKYFTDRGLSCSTSTALQIIIFLKRDRCRQTGLHFEQGMSLWRPLCAGIGISI